MKIRKGLETDLQQLYELDQLCFPPMIAYPFHYFQQLFDLNAAIFVLEDDSSWLIEKSKIIQGFIIGYEYDYDEINITTLDIHPSIRRQGWGKKLLETLEDASREEYEYCSLQVDVSNAAAIELYKQCNYAIQRMIKNYYGAGKHAYEMFKLLNPENE